MISISINQQALRNVEKDIKKYADSLAEKCVEYVEKMLSIGYDVATSNTAGTFGGYISIYKELEESEEGVKGVLYATDSGDIDVVYNKYGEEVSVSISPLLMCEFGSGLRAENPLEVSGVGQGTHPQQTHAFDKNGWWFLTIDGNWIHSYGYTPHAPMYKALQKMESDMINIAKEVFK